jgi:hypothetical protein
MAVEGFGGGGGVAFGSHGLGMRPREQRGVRLVDVTNGRISV